MFVSVEEHEGKWVEELVHLVEVWYFCYINHVEYDEIAEFVCHLHDDLVHLHAVWVPIVAESDDN